MADLASITKEELEIFQQSGSEYLHHLEDRPDRDTQLRIYFMIDDLRHQIGRLRKELLSDRPRLTPYDHPDLRNVPVDDDGLVYLSTFSPYNGGFCLQDEVFTMAPSTTETNSCYWLLQELHDQNLFDRVKIRLSPLIHQPKDAFNPMHFRIQVYGKKLHWERIQQLSAPEAIEFIPDPGLSRDVSKTQLVWKPNDNEIHFTCEELPTEESLFFRGSRYFHAIFDRQTGVIDHCDGAIRYYNAGSYTERCRYHIKSNEATKAGIRIKIFHVAAPSHPSLINLVVITLSGTRTSSTILIAANAGWVLVHGKLGIKSTPCSYQQSIRLAQDCYLNFLKMESRRYSDSLLNSKLFSKYFNTFFLLNKSHFPIQNLLNI